MRRARQTKCFVLIVVCAARSLLITNLFQAFARVEPAQLRDEEQMVVRRERVVAHVLLQAETHTLADQLPLGEAPHVLRAQQDAAREQ